MTDATGGAAALIASGNLAVVALTFMVLLLVIASAGLWRALQKAQDEKTSVFAQKFEADLRQAEADREQAQATRDLSRAIDLLVVKVEARTS